MSEKKITRVGGDGKATPSQNQGTQQWQATEEAKGKAKQFRLLAGLLWLVAIGAQIWAITLLFKAPVNILLLCILMGIDFILVLVGGWLWKKASRLDPASEKNKIMFFMQTQLGMVMAIVALLPLIIFIFTSKNLSGKQKGFIGGAAVLLLAIAGIANYDFAEPSIEKYTEQTREVEFLNEGINEVFWTTSGKKYHLYQDCHHINRDATTEIFTGEVSNAREITRIDGLCKTCQSRRLKEIDKSEEELTDFVNQTNNDETTDNSEE